MCQVMMDARAQKASRRTERSRGAGARLIIEATVYRNFDVFHDYPQAQAYKVLRY